MGRIGRTVQFPARVKRAVHVEMLVHTLLGLACLARELLEELLVILHFLVQGVSQHHLDDLVCADAIDDPCAAITKMRGLERLVPEAGLDFGQILRGTALNDIAGLGGLGGHSRLGREH